MRQNGTTCYPDDYSTRDEGWMVRKGAIELHRKYLLHEN
jgi:hypothetical protein